MMTGCALLGGVSLLGLSVVTELWQFYLVWALIGVMLAGCLYEPCFALVTRARGAEAKQGIILITLVAGFASAISFSAGHALAESFGWRVAVQIFALVVILVATPLLGTGVRLLELSRAGGGQRQPEEHARRHAFLAKPYFWFLALGFALGALLHGVTLHHLLPILYDRGIGPDAAILAASFIGPMQVAGRLAMMAAERHVSNHGVAVACFVLLGASILLLLASGATPGLLAGFVILFGGAYGMVSIIRPVIAREILGESNFGAKSGALALPYLVGAASAPYLGSLVWSLGGYDLVLPCLVVLAVLGLALYLMAQRLSRKAGSTDGMNS